MLKKRIRNFFNSGKYGYLAKNSFLFTVGSFGSKILTFFLVPLYTSVLSTEDYGYADLIATTASLLVYIVTLNIADAVLRFAIEKKDDSPEILKFAIRVIGIGTCVTGVGIGVVVAIDLFPWPRFCYLFLYLHLIGSSVYNLFSCYLQAIDKVKSVSIAGIILTFSTVSCNILTLLVFKWGLLGYLLSIAIGEIIATVYEVYVSKSFLTIIHGNECVKSVQKEMVRFSLPLIFNGIAWWINSSIDRYFITAICGTAINGLYAVASKIPGILSVFNSIFTRAWGLSSIKEYDPKDSDGFFSNTYNSFNSILIIICSLLIFTNSWLAKILFADDFYIAWQYSSILVIASIFSALGGFLGGIFSAVKKNNLFAISTVVAAVANCLLNYLLIPEYNITDL